MARSTQTSPEAGKVHNKKQTLSSHMMAMRSMVIVIAATIFVCFIVIFYLLSGQLVNFVLAPVYARGIGVIATRVSESLMMTLKTCLVTAIVVSMPMIFWQIWSFVGPALYPNERKVFVTVFLFFVLMFAVGIVFSYTVVFPLAIDLFFEASEGVAVPMWSVDGYFNFVLSFILPFGLMFDLPVVIYMLARRGWVNSRSLTKNRKYYILGASVVAAVLTPPDVVSQVLLLIPMLLLYEISVILSRTVKRAPGGSDAAENNESPLDKA